MRHTCAQSYVAQIRLINHSHARRHDPRTMPKTKLESKSSDGASSLSALSEACLRALEMGLDEEPESTCDTSMLVDGGADAWA